MTNFGEERFAQAIAAAKKKNVWLNYLLPVATAIFISVSVLMFDSARGEDSFVQHLFGVIFILLAVATLIVEFVLGMLNKKKERALAALVYKAIKDEIEMSGIMRASEQDVLFEFLGGVDIVTLSRQDCGAAQFNVSALKHFSIYENFALMLCDYLIAYYFVRLEKGEILKSVQIREPDLSVKQASEAQGAQWADNYFSIDIVRGGKLVTSCEKNFYIQNNMI